MKNHEKIIGFRKNNKKLITIVQLWQNWYAKFVVLESSSWSLGQTNNWTNPACFPLSFWSHQGNINPWQAQHVLWASINNLRWSSRCIFGLELTMFYKLLHKYSLKFKLAQWASNSKLQLLQQQQQRLWVCLDWAYFCWNWKLKLKTL